MKAIKAVWKLKQLKRSREQDGREHLSLGVTYRVKGETAIGSDNYYYVHHRWCRDRDLGSGIMSSEAIKEKIERENGLR